jgi:hypothetical protein
MNIAVASRVVEVLLPAVRGLCDTLDATQSESLTMVSVQVVGNAAAIGFAASQGQLWTQCLQARYCLQLSQFCPLTC